MQAISIDDYSRKIYHIKTREYFQEVLQSYSNGSYRSAVVMLYSIVICDLVYKLKDLVEQYQDTKAKDILDEIKSMRINNDRSSEWENKLVEKIYKRTNLLNIQDRTNIEHLKEHRNLSAHPVLDNLDILFNPNKETVRAHMRNMLEGILIKSPILSKEIVSTLVEDISSSNIRNTIAKDNKSLESYLETKYFNHFNFLLEKKVFSALWKFVFKLKNADCNENRDLNFKVLTIMLKRRKQELLNYIEEERRQMSDITDREEHISHLINLCAEYPFIYKVLENHAQVIIKSWTTKNVNFYVRAVFLNMDIKEHISKVKERLTENITDEFCSLKKDDVFFLYASSIESNCLKLFFKLIITHFGTSSSFDEADSRFENCIADYLDSFEKEEFELLLYFINKNNQIYGRRRSIQDDRKIRSFSDQYFGDDFDYENEYPNFNID